MAARKLPVAPRLLGRVKSFDGCWEWDRPAASNGYAQICVRNKTCMPHIESFKIHKGPVPRGMVVMHTCDNRLCINPEHLVLGTQSLNVADKVAKGRQAKGSGHGVAKLTEEAAAYILEQYAAARVTGQTVPGTVPGLAKRFGVSEFAIRRITRGDGWRHVRAAT